VHTAAATHVHAAATAHVSTAAAHMSAAATTAATEGEARAGGRDQQGKGGCAGE
jgi:hypothetical protein